MIVATPEETLRRLALHDEGCIESVLGMHLKHDKAAGLDPKTHALVRVGALVALGAGPVSYHWAVETALASGTLTPDMGGKLTTAHFTDAVIARLD